MILEFKVENFKTFKEMVTFSMIPDNIKDIEYSILKDKVNNKDVKALCSAVIYGPNAAGKTSIINAMSCLKQIVLRGNILDLDENRFDDFVSASMNLIPFAFNDEAAPTIFDITFVYLKTKYNYKLTINLGKFLSDASNREILGEELYINDSLIFSRTHDDVELYSTKRIEEFLLAGFDEKLAKKNIAVAKVNISKTNLFLTSDFDSFISKKIVSNMKKWFNSQFMVVNRANEKSLIPRFESDESKIFIEENINEIAKLAGIIGTDFAYVKSPGENNISLMSVMQSDDSYIEGIKSEAIESVGTIRLIGIMPYIFSAMKNGGTLVMDELDAALHPMIIMNIINVFHNDEINVNKAQIIFNTHNPIYLNGSIFRRDEIKFVERDKETKSSILYSLSDFKTNGKVSVRNTTDYMKNYFINRYGAIEDIDFSNIFKNIIKRD